MFGLSSINALFILDFVEKYLPDIFLESETYVSDINIDRMQVKQFIEEFQSINRRLTSLVSIVDTAQSTLERLRLNLEFPDRVFDSQTDISEHHLYYRHRVNHWQRCLAQSLVEYTRIAESVLVPFRNERRDDVLQLVQICGEVIYEESNSFM